MHRRLQVGSEVSADDELPEFPERAAPLEGVASRLGRVHISLEQAEGSYLQQRVPDGVLHRVGPLQSSSTLCVPIQSDVKLIGEESDISTLSCCSEVNIVVTWFYIYQGVRHISDLINL